MRTNFNADKMNSNALIEARDFNEAVIRVCEVKDAISKLKLKKVMASLVFTLIILLMRETIYMFI